MIDLVHYFEPYFKHDNSFDYSFQTLMNVKTKPIVVNIFATTQLEAFTAAAIKDTLCKVTHTLAKVRSYVS